MPVGNEGGDGRDILLANSQPSLGQPVNPQQFEPAAFAEPSFLPLHSLGLVGNQNLDLVAMPATQSQPGDAFEQAAWDPGMGQTSSSTATRSYAVAQPPAIPNASSNAPMPPPTNLSHVQQAMGIGGMYEVNASGMGQETGISPPGGGQFANAQSANPAVNALATFLQGLALQSQAAAAVAAPPMAPVLPHGRGGPLQKAQAATQQLAMAPQQAVAQQQPMPRPVPVVPGPMPQIPPVPRPPVRPLMEPVAQQQQPGFRLPIQHPNQQPVTQHQRLAAAPNQALQQLAQQLAAIQAAYQQPVIQPPQQQGQQMQHPVLMNQHLLQNPPRQAVVQHSSIQAYKFLRTKERHMVGRQMDHRHTVIR